jgi:hypothetical protein
LSSAVIVRIAFSKPEILEIIVLSQANEIAGIVLS